MGNDGTVRLGWDDAELQAGAKRSEKTVKNFERKTKESFKDLAGVGAKAFAGTFVAGAAGLRTLLNEFDRLGDIGDQLRETPETVQRIAAMAKLSASDVDSVAKALHRVNRALAMGDGADVFQKLGIDVRQYLSLSADEQIMMLAKAFQEAERNGHGLKEANELFGKSAAELLPLLRSNIDSLKEMSQIKVVSDEDIRMIQEFNDLVDQTGMNIKASVVSGGMEAARTMQLFGTAIQMTMNSSLSLAEALDTIRAAQKAGNEEHQKAIEAQKQKLSDARATVIEQEKTARAAEEKAKAEKEAAAEAEKARKKKDDEAKDRAKRVQSLQDLKSEMEVLKLLASGRTKAAEALQREQRIKEEAKRIQEQTGMGEKQALALAREKAALEDKVSNRSRGGMDVRKRTQGYRRSQGSSRGFGGLDEFDRLQQYTSDTGPGGKALRVNPAFQRTGDSSSFKVLPPGSRERARQEAQKQQQSQMSKQGASEGTLAQVVDELRKLTSSL